MGMDAGALGGFIWGVADLLRGDYKQSDYGKVILPFTLLRRLDCVLEATKPQVLDEYEARKQLKMPLDAFLLRKAGHTFYNTSPLDFNRLLADPVNIKANVSGYVAGYSDNARDIFERGSRYRRRRTGRAFHEPLHAASGEWRGAGCLRRRCCHPSGRQGCGSGRNLGDGVKEATTSWRWGY